MDQNEAKKVFNGFYQYIDGYALSRKAQSKLSYYYNAHIYGEIDFDNFYTILKIVKPEYNETFYDLGSGTGKAVILASLCFPFAKCIGIEKLEDLYHVSSEVSHRLNNSKVKFVHNDFHNYDFSDGDILYLNSYYFYYEMNTRSFIRKIQALKKGARLIFVQTPITAPFLQVVHKGDYMFSWGQAKVYISVKV